MALDREDSRKTTPIRRLVVAAAVAAAVIAALFFVTRSREMPSRVAEDYESFRVGRLPVELRTNDPKALEKFFVDRGVRFRTRVLDLDMMGYRLVGGAVLDDGSGNRAFFVYQGKNGEILACQMYEGDLRDLPRTRDVRQRGDFTFLVFRSKDQTQVFWQEGDVVCVLASDIPSEDVVRLAMAKAMK